MCEGLLPFSGQTSHRSMNMPGYLFIFWLFQPNVKFVMLGSELMTLQISELFKLGSEAQYSLAKLCKDDIIKELKRFFIGSFERLGVELHGTTQNKKLPQLMFDNTLN
ncbi:hypothetical protein C8J56DRAFT_891381 [Mycena floridula]|nr:hypothetical protein C8J56DRAFT_891381 [Mycena floridula]